MYKKVTEPLLMLVNCFLPDYIYYKLINLTEICCYCA